MIDVTKVAWRKARACNGSAACVEVVFVEGHVVLRDGKAPDEPPIIFTLAEWEAFTEGVKGGEFDVETLASAAVGSDGSGSPRAHSLPLAAP